MLILNSSRIFHRIMNQNVFMTYSARLLFSENALGITDYENRRMLLQNLKINPKKMVYHMRNNSIDELIKTTKQWIHIMNKDECVQEFQLFKRSLISIQRAGNVSTQYKFGPPLMRALHYLNLPDHALQITFDAELKDLFNGLSCAIILGDLLFENGMYKELLQFIQRKTTPPSSRYINYLTFAACYKLNTPDHLSYGLKIWNESVKDHQLTQSANFLSMLAINMGNPEIALEILHPIDKHHSSISIRLIALTDCRKFTEAIQVINNSKSQEKFMNLKFSQNIIKRIKESLDKHPTTDETMDFLNLLNQVEHPALKYTIDEMLCWPLSSNISTNDKRSFQSPRDEEIQ